jgi:hypothetical protein
LIVTRYSDFRAICAPGAPRDNAGYETWPVGSMLYPPGEAGFNLTLPSALSPFAILSANEMADDAAPGVDEFDWYLWQRTDDPLKQAFALARYDTSGTTRSGTIQMYPTGIAIEPYGLDPSGVITSPELGVRLYRDVWLGVRRRSTGRIMMKSFLANGNA